MMISEEYSRKSWNQWTSSAEDSRARTSALPEKERALKVLIRAFGLSSPALFAVRDPDGFSWRTCQACLFDTVGEKQESGEYLENWPNSGMWEYGRAYALQTSEPATSESGSSLWPTIRAYDSDISKPFFRKKNLLASARKGVLVSWDLSVRAMLWQTPSADPFRSRSGSRKHEMGLDRQARSRCWISPQARDGKEAANLLPEMNRVARGGVKSLVADVVHFHSSRLDQKIQSGDQSLKGTQSLRLRLNPQFVEWLMGFPIGWTKL